MFSTLTVSLHIFMIGCRSQWVWVTDPTLPRSSFHCAAGVYGDSIFIMGGDPDSYQMVEYQIASNTMIDHGLSALSTISSNYGAYFSQSQHTLYIERNTDISVYDLSSPSFPSVSSIPVDAAVTIGTAACTAATVDRVFVLGGWTTGFTATVYMLTLSDNTWSTAPSMITIRVDEACIVVSDYVYAIGGSTTENERMNINDMIGFENIGTLTRSVSMPGVVSYDNIIWVIGGFDDSVTPVDEVWNIDTTDGSVVLLDERLPYTLVAGSGAITIVNNVIYVFGGPHLSRNSGTADWIKYEIPSADHTADPTVDPTNAPSKEPSKEPSNAPSDDPSDEPSNAPNDGPSDNPTIHENEGEVVFESTGYDDESNATESDQPMMNEMMMIAIGIGILLCVFVIVCFSVLYRLKRYRQMKAGEGNEQNAANAINEVVSQSNDAAQSNDKNNEINAHATGPGAQKADIAEMNKNAINLNASNVVCGDTSSDDTDHDSMYEEYREETTNGDTIGENVIFDGMGIHGTCSDCGIIKNGKIYDGNGSYYCFDCWTYYKPTVETITESHNKMYE